MAEEKTYRLSQVARKLNVGRGTILDYLSGKGYEVDSSPNSKITQEQYSLLSREFASSAMEKEEASGLTIGTKHSDNMVIKATEEQASSSDEEEEILIKDNNAKEAPKKEDDDADKILGRTKLEGPKVVGKIDLDPKKKEEPKPEPAKVEEKKEEPKPEPKVEEKKEEPKPEPKVEEKKEEPKPEPVAEEKKEEPKVEAPAQPEVKKEEPKKEAPAAPKVEAKKEEPKKEEPKKEEKIEAKADSLKGLTVLGKIELPEKKKPKPVASSDENKDRKKKRPRKRINSPGDDNRSGGGGQNRGPGGGGHNRGGDRNNNRGGNHRGGNQRDNRKTEELTDKEIQDKIKATLAKLSGGKSNQGQGRSKYRKDKRNAKAEAEEERLMQEQEEAKKLKVTEYISASDLASLMGVSVNDVISTCMSLGMFVSINQRLDAESITVIADEFGYEVEFSTEDEDVEVQEVEDSADELKDRAPIVTIMGHVDHGKTSLLDYIRDSKVTEGEAGGITQHIGAYDVMTEGGKRIAFLDTPGHEAFTAMRARGAKITDVAIIVVAADDAVMPQTKEAINHAQVAGVPIIIAINKVDKPNANPDKIKEELSQMNILVEDWGGKYQCQHVSAKTGEGIDDLLEKVLLEAELLELTANPDKPAVGSVIEATLDKGRGYVTTLMVQAGTMKVGDVVLAGSNYGKVKAMFDHRGKKMNVVGPSTPVLMLGLDGAPQAGDRFNVMESDREAREIATKREQIHREQSIRTKKHITLDEIGRRLAIGSFKELNVIVKGDVDGSIEALSDSLLKLSTEEVQVNIIHKAVGQISESDVLLASASDAIIIGFQVRPSSQARRIAENEEIEIRLYSIIYDAINDVKDAMEGMLEPTTEEVITGNIEVREVFKISKIGTVAGCYVTEGTVKRQNKVRLIRDGIVVYEGEINQLKRFKEDVNEVKNGYECGVSIKNFNDIKVGDIIEGFTEKEVKRTL
ncbi:MAG: translation initiation factor IF-2 [Flammeovirgaceae bacterium]|nr:translation initiation factor IF-2 [Flammeovirgaceae bacterium]MBE61758.1 translation initiation factor IF-2 [Flammeovirgaceae bacterium]MBR07272.1 translation initiation factor IF-2 [Rickettsiales bacterium]HCX24239.1 translation initiation factor IF-2 [Cytophagales bacterium]|tara:strand:+ start:4020 stop:6926 length:2907 start_codon:yes stop_codon:yes gene_type:complete